MQISGINVIFYPKSTSENNNNGCVIFFNGQFLKMITTNGHSNTTDGSETIKWEKVSNLDDLKDLSNPVSPKDIADEWIFKIRDSIAEQFQEVINAALHQIYLPEKLKTAINESVIKYCERETETKE